MYSEKTNLQKVLEAGLFSVTTEIGPPMSSNGELVRTKAKEISGLVDAVNITDNQAAIVRMSSIAGSVLANAQGVEPVVQMTCRDRNRIAIQSDLLGAHALGLKNLLILSGDHQSCGNHPGSKNVYDIDSIQLLAGVQNMMENRAFIGGSEIKHPIDFFLGTTINPFADPQEMQLLRLEKKIKAGAKFVQTQAIYNVEKFANWMEKVRERGLHKQAYILAGVIINRSARSIEFTSAVPGVDVPEELVNRMKNAKDAEAEGLAIGLDLISKIKEIEGVSGIHIMAIGWESIVPTVVEKSGFLPRPKF